jgi:hypothetical protein
MPIKKIILPFFTLFLFSALLISCETSKKGKWTDADKKKARTEIEKGFSKLSEEDKALFGSSELRNKIINCAMSKFEQNYSSFSAADSDEQGVDRIGEECLLELMGEFAPDEEEIETPDEEEIEDQY